MKSNTFLDNPSLLYQMVMDGTTENFRELAKHAEARAWQYYHDCDGKNYRKWLEIARRLHEIAEL